MSHGDEEHSQVHIHGESNLTESELQRDHPWDQYELPETLT